MDHSSQMNFVLLFFLLSLFATIGSGSNLYCVYTSGTSTETIMWTAQIDMTTGQMTNITEVEVFGGGSITIDGISAFDTTNKIYYFTNDNIPPELYSVNIATKQNLPLTDLYVQSINRIAVNPVNYEAVLNVEQSNVSRILAVSYPPGNVRTLVSDLNVFLNGITYDPTTNKFLAMASNQKGGFVIHSIDPQTGSLGKPVQVKGDTFLYPETIFFDVNSGNLVAPGIASNFSYGLLVINPSTGDTQITYPIPPESGIVVASTYDPTTSWLWYSAATDLGFRLYAWDVINNQLAVNLTTPFLPSSLELDPSQS